MRGPGVLPHATAFAQIPVHRLPHRESMFTASRAGEQVDLPTELVELVVGGADILGRLACAATTVAHRRALTGRASTS